MYMDPDCQWHTRLVHTQACMIMRVHRNCTLAARTTQVAAGARAQAIPTRVPWVLHDHAEMRLHRLGEKLLDMHMWTAMSKSTQAHMLASNIIMQRARVGHYAQPSMPAHSVAALGHAN